MGSAPATPPVAPENLDIEHEPLPPLSRQPAAPRGPSGQLEKMENATAKPAYRSLPAPKPLLGFIGPYRFASPAAGAAREQELTQLIRDGKLYLSLHDAIVLALANNYDLEIARYNLVLADADLMRAKGGGNLRGIDYTISEAPPGVGGPGTPLLDAAAVSVSPTAPNVTDLSSLVPTTGTEQNLSQTDQQAYSSGPQIPLYDPNLIAQAGWLRRSDTANVGTSLGTSEAASVTTAPLNFTALNADYIQGFRTGAQLEAGMNNAPEVLYGNTAESNPFHSPSTSVTLSQPLLRGFGPAVNLRFVRVAKVDRQISRLLFEQQVLDTIFGISRLYYDLVSLSENIGVKEQTLAAAEKLLSDDQAQVDLGALAPIELTRVQALVSASRLDLVQAQGQYRQQETILREQLIRSGQQPIAFFTSIVPTDRIVVPDASAGQSEDQRISDLIAEGLANRPDLAQAGLQVKAGEINVVGARSATRPELNVYGNLQVRGSTEAPYAPLGTSGTAIPTPSPDLNTGGLRTSTIYQAGIQLTLPLRNRVAEGDYVRDTAQLRQVQARAERLENQVRTEIENEAIALDNAYSAFRAATESRIYQQQLLDAEIDKYSVGESTNFLVVQDEAYLAQARSTEVAARSNWMKARIALDRALGNLLQKNGVSLDGAIAGTP